MKFQTAVIYSTEAVTRYHAHGLKSDGVMASTIGYEFDSSEELKSFLEGVENGTSSEDLDIDEVSPESTVSRVAFFDEGNDPEDHEVVDHGSVAVRVAYEKGLLEGSGWSEALALEGDDLKEYLEEGSAKKNLPAVKVKARSRESSDVEPGM